jgi:hypothetical protein
LVEPWINELSNSTGKTDYIISMIIDIREFSSYFKKTPSIHVATYIKKIYLEIMKYFPDVTFSKPLGDGILVIISFDETNQVKKINDTVNSCIELVNNFEGFCQDDLMINFDVPKRIGIGIDMGEATCFQCEDKIIEYSGTVLNLSSRLMDMARPGGIVISGYFGRGVNVDILKEHFRYEQVYVRGIHDLEPIDIHYQKDNVIIEERYKKLINQPEWQIIEDELTVREILALDANLQWTIPKKPHDKNEISLTIMGQAYEAGEKQNGFDLIAEFDLISRDKSGNLLMTYYNKGKRRILSLNIDYIKQQIKKDKIPLDEIIEFEIQYPF